MKYTFCILLSLYYVLAWGQSLEIYSKKLINAELFPDSVMKAKQYIRVEVKNTNYDSEFGLNNIGPSLFDHVYTFDAEGKAISVEVFDDGEFWKKKDLLKEAEYTSSVAVKLDSSLYHHHYKDSSLYPSSPRIETYDLNVKYTYYHDGLPREILYITPEYGDMYYRYLFTYFVE